MKIEKILSELITIRSYSGEEKLIQRYIYRYIKSLSILTFFVKGNVIAHVLGKNNKNALVFNTHVDTVSAGDKKLWNSDPFEAKVSQGNIFGLGASDEKGSVAVLLKLAHYFSKHKPECDIFLTFVVNEELDGVGTKDLIKWFSDNAQKDYKNIAGVLGEPTNLKRIEIAHRGNIFVKITTFGKSGHASSPINYEDHAVFKMNKIINHLKIWWGKEQFKYKDPLLGCPSLGLATSIIGGDASVPNKFPDSCAIVCDIRTTPSFHFGALKILNGEVKKVDKHALIGYLNEPCLYGLTKKDESIVNIFRQVTRVDISVSNSSNDMCFFTSADIPAVVFGPGDHTSIHKANEYCKLTNLNKCFEIYQKVIVKFARID